MIVHLLMQESYAVGSQPPQGYLAWHEWAETQHKAGLRQAQCGRCGEWKFPQELSSQIDRHNMKSKHGIQTVSSHVCNDCADQPPAERCPTRNGNDSDMPCAYPSEGMQGCLRDIRLSAERCPCHDKGEDE